MRKSGLVGGALATLILSASVMAAYEIRLPFDSISNQDQTGGASSYAIIEVDVQAEAGATNMVKGVTLLETAATCPAGGTIVGPGDAVQQGAYPGETPSQTTYNYEHSDNGSTINLTDQGPIGRIDYYCIALEDGQTASAAGGGGGFATHTVNSQVTYNEPFVFVRTYLVNGVRYGVIASTMYAYNGYNDVDTNAQRYFKMFSASTMIVDLDTHGTSITYDQLNHQKNLAGRGVVVGTYTKTVSNF